MLGLIATEVNVLFYINCILAVISFTTLTQLTAVVSLPFSQHL